MKLLLFFSILACSFLGQAQNSILLVWQQSGKAGPDSALVLDNYLNLGYSVSSFVWNSENELLLDSNRDGVFQIVIEADTLDFYAENNDTIVFFSDSKGGIGISGSRKNENDLLLDFNQKRFELKSVAASAGTIDALEISLHEKKMEIWESLKKSFSSSVLAPKFRAYLFNELEYTYYNELLKFALYSNKSQVLKIPDLMLASQSEEAISRSDKMSSGAFCDFVLNFMRYEYCSGKDFSGADATIDFLNYILAFERQRFNPQLISYAVSKVILENCGEISGEMHEEVRRKLSMMKEGEPYLKVVLENCAPNISELKEKPPKKKPVKTEYDFELVGLNGKKVSLSDFSGKVIYIDLWASWCGPCRQQFPFSLELKNSLGKKAGKEIVFLYVSLDKTEDAWRKALEKLEIDGVQVIAPGDWNSKIAQFFQVQSIPRYIIIGKDGKVVDANAPRPSSKEIKAKLLDLL